MAGKSIDDILRQQAAQRQAQMQQQQAKERALYEQRERARQDYLQRMRMYEKLSNINPSAAAAAAGGTGTIPTINGHAEFILFTTSDNDNYQYVILDFLAETISKVKDTGVPYSNGYDYYMIENTGWIFEFGNGQTLFINDNAEIVSTVSYDNFYTSWSKRTFYLAYFNDGSVIYFDGKKVTTYTGLPSSSIITQSNFTKNGVLVLVTQDAGTAIVYTWTKENGLTQVWTGPDASSPGERYNSLNVDESADFFTVGQFNDAVDVWRTILVFGEDGTAKSNLNLSPFYSANHINSGYPQFFGTNKMEWKFTGPTSSNYYYNVYDGDTDTWRSSTHTKSANYANDTLLYQAHYDGSQYTSLSDGIVHLLYKTGSTSSAYNIDKYTYLDIVWSIDGSTHSTYTVNNSGANTKGIDINDADRDGAIGSSLYLGKSIFLPMWLNDSKISLLCLTSTQSVVIDAGSTTNLNGSQGSNLIPGWNLNQQYASFRVGDYFGVWLAYNTSDVYKIYNYAGNLALSFTMSTGTRLNYNGGVAVISDATAGIEYVINSNNLGASPSSYATYSYSEMTHYGIKPDYVDGNTTSSKLLAYNEGAFSLGRMYTDENVFEFTIEDQLIWGRYVSDQYVVLTGNNANAGETWKLYFYDWTATLLATIDTGVEYGTSFAAELVKDRLYFKTSNGSTVTYYYFSPTKSDSITIENVSDFNLKYDTWSWWVS